MAKRGRISEQEKQFNVLVGQRICRARKVAGLSAAQLGRPAAISATQVYYYENGAYRCPPFVLSAFARRLKVSLRDLVPNPTSYYFPKDSCEAGEKLF